MADDALIEKMARAIAVGHGAKMTYRPPGGPMQTVAGHWGDASERYSERHWRDYRLAAELALDVANPKPSVEVIRMTVISPGFGAWSDIDRISAARGWP
jgi:hypothetical protein